MIGNLVRRSEKTEDEAVQQNGHSTRHTFARLAFANHMYRLVAGDRARSSQNERKCWLTRIWLPRCTIYFEIMDPPQPCGAPKRGSNRASGERTWKRIERPIRSGFSRSPR